MRDISTQDLLPGMVAAKDIKLNNTNAVLIEKGSTITQKDMAKLAFYSIKEVSIDDAAPVSKDSHISSSGSLMHSDHIRQSIEFKEFKQDFETCTAKFEHTLKDILNKDSEFNLDELMTPIYDLIKKGHDSNSIFDMLHNLREYDDATYTHCINVALMANILAQWLKMSPDEIEIATQAGLLHDIGKMMIPDSIIKKPEKLSANEFETIKKHPEIGYEAVLEYELSNHVKNAILMHHERCDGSGYPLGLKAPQIDRFARLVSIVDVYDAMTSARYYRHALCPFVAIETFEENGFQKYDPEMIYVFLQNIVDTYVTNSVRLNTGEEGEIVMVNKLSLSKPTVKVGDNYIDLSKNPGIYIEAIL